MQSGANKTIRAWEFCVNKQALQGQLRGYDMPRLAGIVRRLHGHAVFSLRGMVDEQQHYLLAGAVSCQVSLTCQRCLRAVRYRLGGDFLLALLRGEDEASDLPARFDPLVLANNDELEVNRVIEDELLLDLPISPMHGSESECAKKYVSSSDSVKPFAGLADLLNEQKK